MNQFSGLQLERSEYMVIYCRLPFDQRTLLGYSVTLAQQFVGCGMVMVVMTAINSMFFGLCWYMEALIDDVLLLLRDMDKLVAAGQPTKIVAAFRQAVWFHNTVIG